MWTALRALEENAELRRRMCRRAQDSNLGALAQQCEQAAIEAENRARLIREVGQPLTLAGLGTFTTALGATFCIPASGSSLVDGAVGLPGPGALSISGTTTVNIP